VKQHGHNMSSRWSRDRSSIELDPLFNLLDLHYRRKEVHASAGHIIIDVIWGFDCQTIRLDTTDHRVDPTFVYY
jgi:hypothetical protein